MATREEEYVGWVNYHVEHFGFSPTDTALLRVWHDLLGSYNPDILYEATNQLLRQEYPSFARDHLKALLPLIRDLEARSLRDRDQAAQGDDRGTCTLCGGTGWVSGLPHPRCVHEGQWLHPHGTCAVWCTCGLGRWRKESWKKRSGKFNPIDLIDYEGLNPRWRQQQALQTGRLRAEGEALRHSQTRSPQEQTLDQALARVLARLQGKVERGEVP